VESKNMLISGDAHLLEKMLRQPSKIWKVAALLAGAPTIRVASQQGVTRAPFVSGAASAWSSRVREDFGPVRRQSADGVLRAHFQS
jgi:hypothetical protein